MWIAITLRVRVCVYRFTLHATWESFCACQSIYQPSLLLCNVTISVYVLRHENRRRGLMDEREMIMCCLFLGLCNADSDDVFTCVCVCVFFYCICLLLMVGMGGWLRIHLTVDNTKWTKRARSLGEHARSRLL